MVDDTLQKETTDDVAPRGAVDLAHCRNGVIFVSGWVFWSEKDPREKQIFLRSQELGETAKLLPISVVAKVRAEVNEYLGIRPDIQTGYSGRTEMAAFSLDELPVGRADVIAVDPKAQLDDMKIGEIEIAWPAAPYQLSMDDVESDLPPIPEIPAIKPQGFFDKLWNGTHAYEQKITRLKSGQAETLSAKNMTAYLLRGELSKESKRALPVNSSAMLGHRIKSASDANGLIVMFDHDYGGGANTFSQKLLAEHVRAGNGVLRFWHSVSDGSYHGQYMTKSETTGFHVDSANDLFRFLKQVPSYAVQINSLWTYPEINRFLDNILRLRLYGLTERLEFFAHDHMGVCPSLFLVNHLDNFCGVPEDLSACVTCLKRNTQDFKTYYPSADIASWRTSWQSLLTNADLIRFFSPSTYRNYLDAYPWLADTPNTVIEGHEVKDIWPRRYDRKRVLAAKGKDKTLRIGVFGFISDHKGSHVIRQLSIAAQKEADAKRKRRTSDAIVKPEVKVFVFGSLDGQTHGTLDGVEIMGPYAPTDLVDICEDNCLDVAFVPSICPETFSFTSKELSLIGIPLVSFDLGGQSDIIKAYENGHILDIGSGKDILKQFKTLRKTLRDT